MNTEEKSEKPVVDKDFLEAELFEAISHPTRILSGRAAALTPLSGLIAAIIVFAIIYVDARSSNSQRKPALRMGIQLTTQVTQKSEQK